MCCSSCVVPECEGPSPSFENSSAAALLPPDACRRYSPLRNHSCLREDFHPAETQPCEHFVYENFDTVYAEFDLACREWLRTAVGTVRNAALPFALVLTGFLSDKFGRRAAFCVLGGCAGALGLVKAFSLNYQMYLAMEFLEAALGYGFNSAAYVMMVELARPSLRTTFACVSGMMYGVGGGLLALLAWRVRSWRRLLLAAHAPALLLPLYWLAVDESVRWLHATGATHRAELIVRKAARWNKIKLNEALLTNLHEQEEEKQSTEKAENPWVSLLKSRVLMCRLGVMGWCWAAVAFVYYGLTINAVSLAGDKYVNFALNMAMEVAASLLLVLVLERFGRKWSIFAAFLLCGIACVTPFVVDEYSVTFGMFFAGKLSITVAFNALYVYTAELFPTAARGSALAACSLAGRLGSLLAPQTPLLSGSVQAALYGACSVGAAGAVALAPETRRAPLPATARAAEAVRRPSPPAPPAPPAPAPSLRVLSADT